MSEADNVADDDYFDTVALLNCLKMSLFQVLVVIKVCFCGLHFGLGLGLETLVLGCF